MKKKQNNVKNIIIAIIIIALIVGYFLYLSNKASKTPEKEVVVTAVQNVLMRNLDNDYPPTPKEVVKYYSELTKCIYCETYTDEQYEELVDKMLGLYDSELAEINPKDFYMLTLKSDIDSFKKDNKAIISYTPSSSIDVETSVINGRECAKLYCTYKIRVGTEYINSREVFELRKDSQGHWKILGFKLDESDKK